MQKIGDYHTHCDRCGHELGLIKPLNLCSVIVDNDYSAYVLCSDCMSELKKFLDGVVLMPSIIDEDHVYVVR